MLFIDVSCITIRSVLAQTGLGILPQSVEIGRYQDIPIEYRFSLI